MKFTNNTFNYLKGNSFSNTLKIKIAESQSVILDRLGYLENQVEGKKVIHLGCADHEEIIEYKIKNNLWLHARLTKRSKQCIGVDIDRDLIELIKVKYKFTNIICADILNENDIIDLGNWDYFLMGEVLEHIDNPVDFF